MKKREKISVSYMPIEKIKIIVEKVEATETPFFYVSIDMLGMMRCIGTFDTIEKANAYIKSFRLKKVYAKAS